MMTTSARFLPLLLLLVTSACGTFQVQVITQSTPTPSAIPAPPEMTPAYPSPQQCAGFPYDLSLPPNPDDPASYIGHHYNELTMPEGLQFKAGGLLTDDLLWEWVGRPGSDMQFLARIICRNPDGSPYNTVVDAIWIPRAEGHYDRATACSPMPESGFVLVFGKYNPNQPPVLLNGVQGWQMFELDFAQTVNLQTLKFEPLPLAGLECIFILSGPGG